MLDKHETQMRILHCKRGIERNLKEKTHFRLQVNKNNINCTSFSLCFFLSFAHLVSHSYSPSFYLSPQIKYYMTILNELKIDADDLEKTQIHGMVFKLREFERDDEILGIAAQLIYKWEEMLCPEDGEGVEDGVEGGEEEGEEEGAAEGTEEGEAEGEGEREGEAEGVGRRIRIVLRARQ